MDYASLAVQDLRVEFGWNRYKIEPPEKTKVDHDLFCRRHGRMFVQSVSGAKNCVFLSLILTSKEYLISDKSMNWWNYEILYQTFPVIFDALFQYDFSFIIQSFFGVSFIVPIRL